MNFCERCNQLVPDYEIKDWPETEFRGNIVPARRLHDNQSPFPCDNKREVCHGLIREPTELEYFMFIRGSQWTY